MLRWQGTNLGKVLDVKQVESLKQLTLAQPELLTAGGQEGPDVLETQELWRQWGAGVRPGTAPGETGGCSGPPSPLET